MPKLVMALPKTSGQITLSDSLQVKRVARLVQQLDLIAQPLQIVAGQHALDRGIVKRYLSFARLGSPVVT